MIIKSHICGVAIAYEEKRFSLQPTRTPAKYRTQGSLFGQQKRKIADACEYMRLTAKNKPLIFVATSPGFLENADQPRFISKFTDNLRKSYGCVNYVWVREYTGHGFPHFHFVADMPKVDVLQLSMYWSGLFGSEAKNSIRLGTAPGKNGRRSYYMTSKRMVWYLTKYIGKAIGGEEKARKSKIRAFGISNELQKGSEPVLYNEVVQELLSGRHQRVWENVYEDSEGYERNSRFSPEAYNWRRCGDHSVWIGIHKSNSKKTVNTEDSQKTE